ERGVEYLLAAERSERGRVGHHANRESNRTIAVRTYGDDGRDYLKRPVLRIDAEVELKARLPVQRLLKRGRATAIAHSSGKKIGYEPSRQIGSVARIEQPELSLPLSGIEPA